MDLNFSTQPIVVPNNEHILCILKRTFSPIQRQPFILLQQCGAHSDDFLKIEKNFKTGKTILEKRKSRGRMKTMIKAEFFYIQYIKKQYER